MHVGSLPKLSNEKIMKMVFEFEIPSSSYVGDNHVKYDGLILFMIESSPWF